MATVSVFTFSDDNETVTRQKLNALAGNLGTEFNGNIDNNNIKANAGISYSKLDLSSGIVVSDFSASGTPDSTTFLRGDNSWAVPAGGVGGGAPIGATYIVQTADGTLTNEQAIDSLSDGLLKHTSGVLAKAISGTDYVTGASTNTLTNKTFDANGAGNSITNIENADINGSAAIALSKLANTGTLQSTELADGTTTLNVTELGTGSIGWIIDGGGAAISTGIKGDLEIPFACTIDRATLLADQTGSIVVDVWKDTYANFPATVADTITAAAKPTISAAVKSQDSTLTGWTTSLNAGDILRFNVDSVSTIERVELSLKIVKA